MGKDREVVGSGRLQREKPLKICEPQGLPATAFTQGHASGGYRSARCVGLQDIAEHEQCDARDREHYEGHHIRGCGWIPTDWRSDRRNQDNRRVEEPREQRKPKATDGYPLPFVKQDEIEPRAALVRHRHRYSRCGCPYY